MSAAFDAVSADCRRSLASAGVARLEKLRDSRVLVTGGTGFVGTWLLATIAYLNDNHSFGTQVTAFARRPSRVAEQAAFLAGRNDIKIIEADVRQYLEPEAGLSWIVHAAGVPDSRHHATNPIDTASVIAEGTARVLRTAEQAEALRGLLHFSSGLVHADGGQAGSRVGAASVYTEAKSYSEALCAAYRTQSRLPIIITRPFTFLGPFQPLDAPWAANNFMHAALNGQPLKMLGSGETERAYLYGSDMAVLALHQLVGGKRGETYDLGGTEALSLMALAQTVVAKAGRPLEIRVNTAAREPGAARLIPDMAKSLKAFGFKPAFSPAQAVARTLAGHQGLKAQREAG